MNPIRFPSQLEGDALQIGVVTARFNADITEALEAACLAELSRLGVDDSRVVVLSVPGALEIPVALSRLADSGRFDALIALGAVIRGETYHFELVANESGAGVSRVSHEAQIPIANGILTTDNDAQAEVRAAEKGADCARAAVEMANLLLALDDEFAQDDDDA